MNFTALLDARSLSKRNFIYIWKNFEILVSNNFRNFNLSEMTDTYGVTDKKSHTCSSGELRKYSIKRSLPDLSGSSPTKSEQDGTVSSFCFSFFVNGSKIQKLKF